MSRKHEAKLTERVESALTKLAASGTGKAKIALAREAASGVSEAEQYDVVEGALRKAGHNATANKFAAFVERSTIPFPKKAAEPETEAKHGEEPEPDADSTTTKGPKGGGRRVAPGAPTGTIDVPSEARGTGR